MQLGVPAGNDPEIVLEQVRLIAVLQLAGVHCDAPTEVHQRAMEPAVKGVAMDVPLIVL